MKSIFRICATLLAVVTVTTAVDAATISGTVTNKTTNKPSAGDTVVLVDVSAGMGDAARAVTDAEGHYSLQPSGGGPYLIRVDHQGGSYFIAAPQGSVPADVTVYDVAAKVEGVGLDADMMLIEAGGGNLRVRERYLVRNSSSPPRTQFSEHTFEVVLPEGALLDEAAATRPGGLGTRTHLIPLPQKGHYAFNVPIQPDQGEKETLFEVQYHFPYSGKHQLAAHPQMPADNFVVYTAKGIDFTAKDSSKFKQTQEDPRVDTHVVHGVQPGEEIAFTVSGEGQMPPDTGASMQPANLAAGGRPGGGIEEPIAASDSAAGWKFWLLGGFGIVLAASAFLFLRKRNGALASAIPVGDAKPGPESIIVHGSHSRSLMSPQSSPEKTMLETLKDEFFALEEDNISGRISAEEYQRVRIGLEALLKRTIDPKT